MDLILWCSCYACSRASDALTDTVAAHAALALLRLEIDGFVGQTITARASVPSLAGSLSYPFQKVFGRALIQGGEMPSVAQEGSALQQPRLWDCCWLGSSSLGLWWAAEHGQPCALAPRMASGLLGCTNRGTSGRLKEGIIVPYSAVIRPCLTELSFGPPKERHELERVQQRAQDLSICPIRGVCYILLMLILWLMRRWRHVLWVTEQK